MDTAVCSCPCVAVVKSRVKLAAAVSSAEVIVKVVRVPGVVPDGVPIEIRNCAIATTDGVEALAEEFPLAWAQLTGVITA